MRVLPYLIAAPSLIFYPAALILVILSLSPTLYALEQGNNPLELTLIVDRSNEIISKELVAAAEGQLIDLPVSLHVEWVDVLEVNPQMQLDLTERIRAQRRVDVVVWAYTSSPDTALMFIAEADSDTSLLRIVRFEGDSRLETLAMVLRGVITAFLEGGQIGISVQVPVSESPNTEPEPLLEPKPKPKQNPILQPPDLPSKLTELAISYLGSYHAASSRYLNGARVQLSLVPAKWIEAFFAYRIQIPYQGADKLASIRISPHPFEVGTAGIWRFKSLFVGVGAAFIADKVTWSVKPLTSDVYKLGAESRWIFAIAPYFCEGFKPNHSTRIFISLGVDLDLYRWNFVVKTDFSDQILVKRDAARPWFSVGAAFSFL